MMQLLLHWLFVESGGCRHSGFQSACVQSVKVAQVCMMLALVMDIMKKCKSVILADPLPVFLASSGT